MHNIPENVLSICTTIFYRFCEKIFNQTQKYIYCHTQENTSLIAIWFLVSRVYVPNVLTNWHVDLSNGCITHEWLLNSSSPSIAYIRRWTGSTLVMAMACRLFGAKPLSESILTNCQLYHKDRNPVKWESTNKTFHSWTCVWKCRMQNDGHFA